MDEEIYKIIMYLKNYQSRLYADMLEQESNMSSLFQDEIDGIQDVLKHICTHDWVKDEFEVAPHEKIMKVCICSICDSLHDE